MIVLDTHAWVWWIDGHPRLKRSVRDKIDTENDVRVSAISLLEIATAVSLGRLMLRPSAEHWLQVAQAAEQISNRAADRRAVPAIHDTARRVSS